MNNNKNGVTKMTIKFTCPDCGHDKLECCMNGPHSCTVTRIDEEGDFEYGPYESTAEVDRWQCQNCGYVLDDENKTITDNLKVAEWCEKNCQQG